MLDISSTHHGRPEGKQSELAPDEGALLDALRLCDVKNNLNIHVTTELQDWYQYQTVVGRILRIYTQVKAKLLPSKSTWVNVNIPIWKPTWARVKKYFVIKLLKLLYIFVLECLDQWKRHNVFECVSEWGRERDPLLKHFFTSCFIGCIVH